MGFSSIAVVIVLLSLQLTDAPAFAADSRSGAIRPSVTTGNREKSPADRGLVDINSASDAQLKALPGLGDAYAAKIIAWRPYANKAQLKSRNILPAPVYEKVKNLIIARQPSRN